MDGDPFPYGGDHRKEEGVTEKPLHVQVAEALGCKPVEGLWCDCSNGWSRPHGQAPGSIYRYDADWRATGPLIEKYEMVLEGDARGRRPEDRWLAWYDFSCDNDGEHSGTRGYGPTPLIAVCNLILKLKEAGKLIDTQDRKA